MSFQTRDADLFRKDAAETLAAATEVGLFPGMVGFRRTGDTDADFVADVYDDEGRIVASYPVHLAVGAPILSR